MPVVSCLLDVPVIFNDPLTKLVEEYLASAVAVNVGKDSFGVSLHQPYTQARSNQ